MSRELKFRAWDKKKKKMLFGVDPFAIHVSGDNDTLLSPTSNNEDCEFEQYTGLKDKNGVEVYEGDIIKQLMYVLEGKKCITTWVVRWNNDEFCYDLHRVSGAMYGDSMLSTCESKDCEVIGNKHENPELLKGERL